MDLGSSFIAALRWQDVVDILLNSYILFRLYVLFRGTNVIRVIVGIRLSKCRGALLGARCLVAWLPGCLVALLPGRLVASSNLHPARFRLHMPVERS